MALHKADSPTSSSLRDEDIKAPYQPDAESQSEPKVGTFGTVQVIDHVAERALCRKFDFRLLPVLAVMYLFNALDKGNLGNAKTVGASIFICFLVGRISHIPPSSPPFPNTIG